MCLIQMGVDVPVATVKFNLEQQAEWDKNRQKRSTKEMLHKRYHSLQEINLLLYFGFRRTFRKRLRRSDTRGRRS